MAKKIIDIDGYIGEGGFSSGYVKLCLREAGSDPVELHINSLGGDVSHAIAIKDMIQAHGDVTAHYSGMSASSATIISLGAKKVTMSKDSFYLIHKPMMFVAEFAMMNEDELKSLISKLDNELENAKRITLQMAKMYSEKTGQTVKEILSLMEKEQWLSAKEAKALGFIDEIVEPVKVTNYAGNLKLVAMISGNGLPPIPQSQQNHEPEDLAAKINAAGEHWLNKLKEFFQSNTKKVEPNMSKKLVFASLFAALAIESLEASEDGAFLNETQLGVIDARLKELQDAKTAADAALAAANQRVADAEAALAAANTQLDDLSPDVKAADTITAKVEAVRKELAKKPGTAVSNNKGTNDPLPRNPIAGADDISNYVSKLV